MVNAILRILFVSLAVVAVVAGFIVLARNTARQEPQTPPHPWFDRPMWHVRAPTAADLCARPPAAAPDVILVLPVHRTPARWQVACPTEPALDEYLAASPHADWLIDVAAGAGEDLDDFVKVVSRVPGKRIGIHAASQRAARALRKKEPRWVYAADDASLLRLHLFTSLFLETVVEFWPDFVIAGDRVQGANRLTAREVAELNRRRKRILWDGGPDASVPTYPVDGVFRRAITD